jgi:transketolase
MNVLAQRDVFGDTLVEICEQDSRVVVLDGDLANSTKSDKVALAKPERFFMIGIAEQNLAGVAAGMASVGLIPWVSSFAAFLATRDLDQIRVVIAQPRLNVKFAAHYSGILTGYTGKTHQVVNDIAIMRSMPNMTVIAPCDGAEARAAIQAATQWQGPVYLRLTRDPIRTVTTPGAPFEIGHAYLLREGADLAIISTGAQTVRALEAADILQDEGVSACLLHVPTLKPLDEEAIVALAQRAPCVLTCEEHSVFGGLGGAVAEVLASRRPTRITRLGLRDVDGESAPNDALLEKYGLNAHAIAKQAREILAAT